jgi:hypothetical protein
MIMIYLPLISATVIMLVMSHSPKRQGPSRPQLVPFLVCGNQGGNGMQQAHEGSPARWKFQEGASWGGLTVAAALSPAHCSGCRGDNSLSHRYPN